MFIRFIIWLMIFDHIYSVCNLLLRFISLCLNLFLNADLDAALIWVIIWMTRKLLVSFFYPFFLENRSFDHRQLNLIHILYQWNSYPIILKPYTFNGKYSEVSWPKFTAPSDSSLIPLNFCRNFWPIVCTSLWFKCVSKIIK